jgi:hypothetical protein
MLTGSHSRTGWEHVRLHVPRPVVIALALASAVVVLAGCGGGEGSASPAETEATAATEPEETLTIEDEVDETTAEPESASGGSSGTGGPPPAAGQGRLALDDGRSFTITIAECEFQPNGTFTVKGTSDAGKTFEMTQFYLGDDWSQSQVSLEDPATNDQIYVITSSASDGAEPATVAGKSVSWTQTFRELDESENRHVYTGEGTVQLTCT